MKTRTAYFSFPYQFILIILACCLLPACEKTNQPTTTPARQSIKKFSATTFLEGMISNHKETVKTGYIKATDSKNRRIADTELQANGRYRIEIPANTELPIVLSHALEPNQAGAGGETLIAAVVDPSITNYDINPLTTAIAEKARALGGYTRANMVMAAESTVNVPEANKTSTGFRGDPTTQYGGWH